MARKGTTIRPLVTVLLLAAPFVLATTSAFGAEASRPDASEAVLIAQIVLLLICGRLLGEAMQRLGQPAVTGQMIAGILLGPSLFGAFWPATQHLLFPSDEAR